MLKEAYTPYVDNFDIANALFVKLKLENKKFVDFLVGKPPLYFKSPYR